MILKWTKRESFKEITRGCGEIIIPTLKKNYCREIFEKSWKIAGKILKRL